MKKGRFTFVGASPTDVDDSRKVFAVPPAEVRKGRFTLTKQDKLSSSGSTTSYASQSSTPAGTPEGTPGPPIITKKGRFVISNMEQQEASGDAPPPQNQAAAPTHQYDTQLPQQQQEQQQQQQPQSHEQSQPQQLNGAAQSYEHTAGQQQIRHDQMVFADSNHQRQQSMASDTGSLSLNIQQQQDQQGSMTPPYPPPSPDSVYVQQLTQQQDPPQQLRPPQQQQQLSIPALSQASQERSVHQESEQLSQQPRKVPARSNIPRNSAVGFAGREGLGKVYYFLDQMKLEVTDADRLIKTLQTDNKCLVSAGSR
jgi:hypothetical protein